MSKLFLVGVITGFALLIGFGMVGAWQSEQTLAHIQRSQAAEAQYRVESSDATPVRAGVLDDRQRLHSKIGENVLPGAGEALIEAVAPYKGKRIVYGLSIELNLPSLSADPEPPASYFGSLAELADLVIRGKVTNKASNITEDGTFLFTDYDVQVAEVLKSTTSSVVQVGSTITVTCAGGKVLIDDVVVITSGNGVAMLPNNHEILLFLTRIPGTSDYKLARLNAAFDIDAEAAHTLAGRVPESYLKDKLAFLRIVRTASKQ